MGCFSQLMNMETKPPPQNEKAAQDDTVRRQPHQSNYLYWVSASFQPRVMYDLPLVYTPISFVSSTLLLITKAYSTIMYILDALHTCT